MAAEARMTEKENVLSWDCGMSNLAYCFLEYVDGPEKEYKIHCWENFSLNERNVTNAVGALVRELESRPWMMQADNVCIESQVADSPTMKIISHALQTYFLTKSYVKTEDSDGMQRFTTRGPKVHFVSPQNKFKVCAVQEVDMAPGHARNKKVAILMAKKMLKKQREAASLEYLASYKKQDDLCDSFLQGIYFMRQLQKKRKANSTIRDIIGNKAVSEVFITEHDDDKANRIPRVYRSESFRVPSFDVEGASVSLAQTFRREKLG